MLSKWQLSWGRTIKSRLYYCGFELSIQYCHSIVNRWTQKHFSAAKLTRKGKGQGDTQFNCLNFSSFRGKCVWAKSFEGTQPNSAFHFWQVLSGSSFHHRSRLAKLHLWVVKSESTPGLSSRTKMYASEKGNVASYTQPNPLNCIM